MPSSDETYNGWPNRETWATALHVNNDEGLQAWACELASEAWEQALDDDLLDALGRPACARYVLADRLKDQFGEWAESWVEEPAEVPRGIRMMLGDIGSLYRVDWDSVADSFLEELAEELAAPITPGWCCPGWCCTDCLIYLANGELPPEASEDEAADFVDRVRAAGHVTPGRALGQDDCECTDWGCDEHRERCERQEFSGSRCDICGSTLAGERHAVTFDTREPAR